MVGRTVQRLALGAAWLIWKGEVKFMADTAFLGGWARTIGAGGACGTEPVPNWIRDKPAGTVWYRIAEVAGLPIKYGLRFVLDPWLVTILAVPPTLWGLTNGAAAVTILEGLSCNAAGLTAVAVTAGGPDTTVLVTIGEGLATMGAVCTIAGGATEGMAEIPVVTIEGAG